MLSHFRFAPCLTSAVIAVSLLFAQNAVSAQKKNARADPDGPGPKVGLTIALSAGTARYDFTGQGVCVEIPDGSIFGEPAALYAVHQTGAKQRFNMTLYRLKKGGDMVTLNLTIGKDTHSVSTVKVGESGAPLGTGTATLERAGAGGTLTIKATDTRGVALSGTVTCDAFNRPSESNGL